MSKFFDGLERRVFGATAQERVHMLTELAARRVEQRLAATFVSEGPEYSAVLDAALDAALDRGVSFDEAYADAERTANEWKAAQTRADAAKPDTEPDNRGEE